MNTGQTDIHNLSGIKAAHRNSARSKAADKNGQETKFRTTNQTK